MKPLLYLLFVVSPLIGGELSGKITDSSGNSIYGIRICTTSWLCKENNQDGTYTINFDSRHSNNVRFSKYGYKAVTIGVSSNNNNIDIVLEKATADYNEWLVPNCSVNNGSENKLVGNNRFHVVLSNKISEIKSDDVDYKMIAIPYLPENKSGNRDNYLFFMVGPTVSSGLPSLSKSFEIIHDKDVTYENEGKLDNGIPYNSIVDIKSRSKDGKISRFIGHA